ncbi:MAG: hypothetical protein ACUVSA_10940 [Desulfosoma sp.]|uniref:hypothetical protein n=1 Tax=Desulfosoma sp. TaxID=2603217 RepID=UPI00404A2B80
MKVCAFIRNDWKSLWCLVGLMLLLGAAGCATGPDFRRSRPVQLAPLDVIAWRPYEPYAFRQLCVVPFQGPRGMESVGVTLASIYRQVLAREDVFSVSVMMDVQRPGTKADFGLEQRPNACGLVLTGTVEQIHVGSGALPTLLVMTVRIVDGYDHTTLWEVMQTARSFPSSDVDLFWHVVSGSGAADHRRMARHMARQLASFLKGDGTEGTAGREAPDEAGG